MSVKRDPRYDVLFDTVAIGPVTAPNRFYQVPHCNGMGRMFPDSMISMRGTKAEGGWELSLQNNVTSIQRVTYSRLQKPACGMTAICLTFPQLANGFR